MQRAAVTAKTPLRIKSEEVSEMNYDTSMQDRGNSTPTSSTAAGQKNAKSKEGPDWNLDLKFRSTGNLLGCPLQPLTTPTTLYQVRLLLTDQESKFGVESMFRNQIAGRH